MEGVEDIPGPVLAEGLKWDWESFPDFLDALERMPRTIDVAAQVPHHPLRVYVMGDRAIRREPATAEDIAEMRRLTEEAVLAGAFGFTTSRTNAHKTTQGEMVPGRFAEIDELTGIGAGLGAAQAGTFGMNSDFEDETAEFAWITRLAKETGRPVWFLLTDRPTDPERWRRIMAGVHQARAAGASVTAQVAGRPVGVILGIATSLNPFAVRTLPTIRGLAVVGAPLPPPRSGGTPGDPRRPAVTGSPEPLRAARAVRRRAMGPHVRDGRSARLRAAGRDQRCRDRGA
jgi:N-acyl-D-aspartate/D-glutamate deacylase